MKTVCDVYRSQREEEMYLYVDKSEGLQRVPEKLLELFGEPKHLMTMLLTPEKKLARAESGKVLGEIRERGFYLQMPPPKDDEMRSIAAQNSKLQR